MPENSIGALSPYTRDDARYWNRQPADHNEAGFFIGGPQEAAPVTARLAQTPLCPWTPETPTVAHARMNADRAQRRRVLARQVAFVRALKGSGPFVKGRVA